MIVIFQSKASGDVIMFGGVAYEMMKIMGKEASPKGIVTVEQLPDAIARLRAAVVADKEAHARQWEKLDEMRESGEASNDEMAQTGQQGISLTQRAVPLLELLEHSLRKKVPVVWGV